MISMYQPLLNGIYDSGNYPGYPGPPPPPPPRGSAPGSSKGSKGQPFSIMFFTSLQLLGFLKNLLVL